jgi:hypothetical protein
MEGQSNPFIHPEEWMKADFFISLPVPTIAHQVEAAACLLWRSKTAVIQWSRDPRSG